MQRLHHGLELVDLVAEAARGVAHVGGEEADRVVPPVVREPALGEMPVHHELVHGQQLERRDAETLEVLDHRVAGEPQVRPAQLRRHVGVPLRHPLYVALVDHGAVVGDVERSVVLPGEGVVDHDALRHAARRIVRIGNELLPAAPHRVGKEIVAPLDRPGDRPRVRVDQQLRGVEAVPQLRLVRPVHAVAVELARRRVGEVAVPHLIGALGEADLRGLHRVVGRAEEAELHCGGVLGEEGEVHTGAVPGGAQRIGTAGPHAHRHSAPSAPSRTYTAALHGATRTVRVRRSAGRGASSRRLGASFTSGSGSAAAMVRVSRPEPP